jgi:hypothetical protein
VRTLLIALLAAAPPATGADEVAAFHCGTPQHAGLANVRDVHTAYGLRSVAIVRSALAADAAALSVSVAPTAAVSVFEGDVGVGPRSKGVAAAIEFAHQISPRSYRFSAGSPGPFSMDPCGSASAELTFIGDKPNEAVVATFKYQDGLLADVQASRIELISGDLQLGSRP